MPSPPTTTTSPSPEPWLLGIGAEILLFARRIEWDVPKGDPYQAPVIMQKFTDMRMVPMRALESMKGGSWRNERLAAAIGELHTNQSLNLIRFLEHGTGEEYGKETEQYSILKGWRTWVPEGTPFDVERCRLYYVRLFELRAHWRWDYEAVTLKLESLVGLEVI
jgi:hypothetical protein